MDGTLSIWSLNDGMCMAFSPFFLTTSPTCMTVLSENRIAVGGTHNDIEIVDINSLKIVRKHEGHTEWIIDLVYGKHEDGKKEKTQKLKKFF
jgi:WD40 repeat protein